MQGMRGEKRMNKAIKERISALLDGELSEFETRRVIEEIKDDPHLKQYWSSLVAVREGFKEETLSSIKSDISRDIANELGYKTYPEEKISEDESTWSITKSSYVAASGIIAVIVVLTFNMQNTISVDMVAEDSFSTQASQRIAQAIESPEAINLLNTAVQGIEAKLEGLDSSSLGMIQANYVVPSSGHKFKVNLSPISSSYDISTNQPSKLVYLRTNKGLFVLSISGNIDSKQKAKILRNAAVSFNTNK